MRFRLEILHVISTFLLGNPAFRGNKPNIYAKFQVLYRSNLVKQSLGAENCKQIQT